LRLLEEGKEKMMERYNTVVNPYVIKANPEQLAVLYLRHIHRRVHDLRFNYLGIITGKHRTGKSLGALSFSYVLDPTFFDDLENRVVYYANDFMKALQRLKNQRIKGGCVIFDEAGVGFGSRDWYNETNKAIGGAMQVVGRYQPIVFFVSQDIKLIDSQIRKYFHGFYEMYRRDNKFATCIPYNVSFNKRTGKIYYLYTRMDHPNEDASGQTLRLNGIRLKRPPRELEKKYEDHSKMFKDYIMQLMENQTQTHDPQTKQKKISDKQIIEEICKMGEDDLCEFLSKRSTKDSIIIDKDSIRFKYNVSDAKARFLKRKIEREINIEK
jgi:hypothetical protein